MDSTPLDLEQQLQRHGGALRRLAGELVRDPAAADDAVQETWLHAARRGPRHDGQVGGWLVTILRRTVRRKQRGERRRQQREQAVARELVVADHAEVAARTEIAQQLVAAVDELDAPFREAIWQRYFEDLPPREIAQRSGEPLTTVKSRLQRGLQQLRERLGEGEEAETDWRAALSTAFGFGEGAATAATVAAWQGGLLMATSTKAVVVVAAVALAAVVAWGMWPRTDPVAWHASTSVAIVAADAAPVPAPTQPAVAAADREAVAGASTVAAKAPSPPAAGPAVGVGGVRGRAVDADSGQPLAGVEVVLTAGKLDGAADGERPTVTTAADGVFEFSVRALSRASLQGRRSDHTPFGWRGETTVGHVEDIGDQPMHKGRVLRGRVVEATGEPIPAKTFVSVQDRTSAYTGDDGSFITQEAVPLGPTQWRIPFGPFELVSPLSIEIGEREPAEVVLTVRRRPTIRGFVVDQDGQPVANVMLSDQPVMGTVQSAADGSFTMTKQRPGVMEGATIYLIHASGCEPHAPIENVPWGTENLRIELRRTRPFAIEVVDDRGAPVEGFGVALERPGLVVFELGKVWQRGQHAGGRLAVEDVVRGATQLRVLPGDPELTPSGRITVGDVEPLRVVLERRTALRVLVQRHRHPVAGVAVRLVREYSVPSQVRSFDVPDPTTADQVWIRLRGGLRETESIALATTDGAGLATLLRDSDLTHCAFYLQVEGQPVGIVRDFVVPADGAPMRIELPAHGTIVGRVELRGRKHDRVRIEVPKVGLIGGFAIPVAADGSFVVPDLQEGSYRLDLQVMPSGVVTLASTDVVVVAGEKAEVAFDLDAHAMASVSGEVTAAAPLPQGLQADLYRQGDGGQLVCVGTAKVEPDGSFVAAGLPPGTYRIGWRTGPSLPTNLPALQADTFVALAGVEVRVPVRYAPRRLVVRMQRPDGAPVRSERVLMRCADTTWPSFRMFTPMVDEVLVLDPAPALSVEFRNWTEGSPWSVPIVMPPDRSEVEVTVVLPDAPR